MGRLLDEDAVIKVLECWQKAFRENSHYVSASDLSLVVKDVRELPTVQPEPHEGEWEQVSAQRYFMSASYFYRCSACGVNNVRNTNFCPHCGAKMTISTK